MGFSSGLILKVSERVASACRKGPIPSPIPGWYNARHVLVDLAVGGQVESNGKSLLVLAR